MNIILSSTVLASVLAPAFSFSYLDQLGSAPVAAAAPAFVAPVAAAPAAPAPVAAAPSAPYVSGFVDTGDAPAVSDYHDSLNIGQSYTGPGVPTHVDSLNIGTSLMGGQGIHTYAENLPAVNIAGGAGVATYTDALSPGTSTGQSFSPFGSSAAPAASGNGASTFTLETSDGSLRLTGTIDDITYN